MTILRMIYSLMTNKTTSNLIKKTSIISLTWTTSTKCSWNRNTKMIFLNIARIKTRNKNLPLFMLRLLLLDLMNLKWIAATLVCALIKNNLSMTMKAPSDLKEQLRSSKKNLWKTLSEEEHLLNLTKKEKNSQRKEI